MKKYLLLYFLLTWKLVSLGQIQSPNEFLLSGQIQGAKKMVIYLIYTNSRGIKERDSCRLKDGHFSFRGNIVEPTFGFVKMNSEPMPDSENRNIAVVFLEPASMHMKLIYDHFDKMSLTGSFTHEEYTTVESKRRHLNLVYSDSLSDRHSKLSEEYIFSHRNSYLSAYLLSNMRGRWNENSLKFLFTRLEATVKNGIYGREVKDFLDGLDTNSEGRPAYDFSAEDYQSKVLTLSDFSGKYVLLDFWGSWCVPCRESSPHIIELHRKYSSKGLTVIGIAEEYDSTGTKWKEAIQKDGTDIWYNVMSNPLNGSSPRLTREISERFSVHVFPTKLLIDPCGYIIGRYHGTDEDKRLADQLEAIYTKTVLK